MEEESINHLMEEIKQKKNQLADRISLDPENVDNGLAQIVLTVVELLRQLVEKQVMRKIDRNTLTEDQIEKAGQTLMRLEEKVNELKLFFKLDDEDLKIKLGSIQNLD